MRRAERDLKKDVYKEIFAPDSGALLQIVVLDTGLGDWQQFLKQVASDYLLAYAEDGVQCPLPDIETIFQKRAEKTVMLEVMLPGFTINCNFFRTEAIEVNLLPEDVNSLEKANAVFQLMTDIATVVNKQVFLTPEFGSASSEKLRELAVCVADPGSPSVRCRLQE